MSSARKLLFTCLLAIAILSLAVSVPVFAQNDLRSGNFGMNATADAVGGNILPRTGTLPAKVGTIVNALLGFIGIVFFLLVLYAGFKWMIARGNADEAQKAKGILEAAAIGIVIVLAAYAITQFVFTSIGGGGSTQTPTDTGCCKFKTGEIVTACQTAAAISNCRGMVGGEDARSWVPQSCATISDCAPYLNSN